MTPQKASILLLLLTSVFAAVNIVLWLELESGATTIMPKRAYSYKGHDHPDRLPLPHNVRTILVPFKESVRYPALGVASDAVWRSIAAPSFGYVHLGPEDRIFVVTAFHELHCLRMLNLALSPNTTPVSHVKHCLNYLRQGILCAPDLALEPGNFEEKDFDIERTHGMHECRDWDAVHRAVTDNFESWLKRTGYDYTLSQIYGMHSLNNTL